MHNDTRGILRINESCRIEKSKRGLQKSRKPYSLSDKKRQRSVAFVGRVRKVSPSRMQRVLVSVLTQQNRTVLKRSLETVPRNGTSSKRFAQFQSRLPPIPPCGVNLSSPLYARLITCSSQLMKEQQPYFNILAYSQLP